MKVIRCKDCALVNDLQCPLNYIDKQRIMITERSPMFFCGKAQTTEKCELTNGDWIRNMSDAELALFLAKVEKIGITEEKQKCKITNAYAYNYWKTYLKEEVKADESNMG